MSTAVILRNQFGGKFALQRYLPAREALDLASRSGFTHWYLDASLESDYPENWTSARISLIKELSSQTGCWPIVHSNFRLPLASDVVKLRKAALGQVKSEICLAAHFRAPTVIHGGPLVEPRKPVDARKSALGVLMESLEELRTYAASEGLEVWLENLANHSTHPFMYLATTLNDFQQIMEAIPELGFFVDIGHLRVNNNSYLEDFAKLLPSTKGISLSDNFGQRDGHLPIGRGDIDFTSVLNHLIATDWSGVIALETRGSDPATDLRSLSEIATAICNDTTPHTPA
jgi:sugar phosphate isomerase/epimerase